MYYIKMCHLPAIALGLDPAEGVARLLGECETADSVRDVIEGLVYRPSYAALWPAEHYASVRDMADDIRSVAIDGGFKGTAEDMIEAARDIVRELWYDEFDERVYRAAGLVFAAEFADEDI